MAKKNIFSDAEIAKIKKELTSYTRYMENLDVFHLEDDIDWKPMPKGGVALSVVTPIEYMIGTVIGMIKSSGNMVLALIEKEGPNDYTEGVIFILMNTLQNIQAYYEQQPVEFIEHRRVEKELGVDKKGNKKVRTFLVASKDSIIRSRATTMERITELIPLFNKLETASATVDVKGGKGVPESMKYL